MMKHDETVARTRAPRGRPTIERTPWGYRRKLATTQEYELRHEVIGAGANLGIVRAAPGQLTVFVLSGVLWVKDTTTGKIGRLSPGHTFTSTPERGFQLGTGQKECSVLVVESAGLALERAAGTANQLDRRPSLEPSGPTRRPQRSFEERAAQASAAQGLGRVQPLPGQPRSAAEVAFGFSPSGTNPVPLLPDP